MTWVMTSRRYEGKRGVPPRTEFALGNIIIATIELRYDGEAWKSILFYNNNRITCASFGEAMIKLHEALNGMAPEGFEIFRKRRNSNDPT